MRILGVDPGLRATGYAVVQWDGSGPRLLEAGVVRARPPRPLPERLEVIYSDLRAVIAEFQPLAVCLETLYSQPRFPRTALQMAHVRGVVCLAAAIDRLPVLDLSPAEVKNAIVGTGRASKAQVQRTVQTLYGLEQPPRPIDVADAIAIATAAAYRLVRLG